MGALRQAIVVVCAGIAVIAVAVIALNHDANAQALGYGCRVFGRHPCAPAPSLCGVFGGGRPCLPYDLPPLSEDLRLTIVSTDANDPAAASAAAPEAAPEAGSTAPKPEPDTSNNGELDTLRAMYAALRACWVPPPKDDARHGMQYTVRFAFKRDGSMVAPLRVTYASHDAPPEVRNIYRDAIDATLSRCLPLHFTAGLGGAVAGRPIAIRFVDNRSLGSQNSGSQSSGPQNSDSQHSDSPNSPQ